MWYGDSDLMTIGRTLSMKALHYPTWGSLEFRDLAVPPIGEGEVLLRVFNCGICGSELETFKNSSQRRTPPLIMGHEFCGVVEQVQGENHHSLLGRRVLCHAVVHCGRCTACRRGDTNLCTRRQVFGMHRPGGFAEYVAVPERVLLLWPENLPDDSAVFTEPLANGINAMRQGGAARRSRIVIIGAGPIGLMCLFAARRLHQSSVIVSDRVSMRLDVARLLGAEQTVNPLEQDLDAESRKHWGGERAEFVIDAVGSAETKQLAIDLVEPGGTVVWVGLHEDAISLNSYPITLEQKCVAGSYSGSLNDLRLAAQILSEGTLDTTWVSRYPVEQGETGFRELLRSDAGKIKVVLQF
jgi:threonine dehydrogenase-like Zn-dependent dehydrogenase